MHRLLFYFSVSSSLLMFLKLVVILFFCQSRKHTADGVCLSQPSSQAEQCILPTGLHKLGDFTWTPCVWSFLFCTLGPLSVPHYKLMLGVGAGIIGPGCGNQDTNYPWAPQAP